ncbi:hypothetical protein BOSEA31B_14394 [Hyphomicrobiales bacterium]|nr:hypothetical protein BOSEA31B_14394 [Hyphomicrobiales bacterium]
MDQDEMTAVATAATVPQWLLTAINLAVAAGIATASWL